MKLYMIWLSIIAIFFMTTIFLIIGDNYKYAAVFSFITIFNSIIYTAHYVVYMYLKSKR